MIVIGIGHRSRTGKTTFAQFLACALQTRISPVVVHGIGDEIKASSHIQYADCGLGDAEYYQRFPEKRTSKLSNIGMTPVEIWVRWGNLGRAIDPLYWVERVEDYAAARNAMALILPDIRTRAEMDWIRAWGGWCYRVDRDVPAVPGATVDDELSSLPAVDWDGIILNTGDLPKLEQTASAVAEEITI